MTWIGLSIVSAGLLGVYDVTKKVSVRDNAVPIVLLLSVLVGAVLWGLLLGLQAVWPAAACPAWLRVDPISPAEHFYLFAKAALVGCSWTLAFYSLKVLPLSIAAPIRSTSPLWTLLIAVTFLGERPTTSQWWGIAVILVSFWMLSLQSAKEGIVFAKDRWIAVMIAATLLGSCSAIYDKILLQQVALSPATVQAWFSIYLVPVMIPLAWRWSRTPTAEAFVFRRSILLISPLLLATDMLYFTALADPAAMVSVVAALRRCSVVVALLAGTTMRGEVNLPAKLACVVGLLLGTSLILL